MGIIMEHFRPPEDTVLSADRRHSVPVLPLRIVCLALVVSINIFHVRTILMFRLEQIVSSGTYISYIIILFGMILAMCLDRRLSLLLEAYFLSVGIALFTTIGVYIIARWRDMDHFTEAIAQLMEYLGTPVKKYNICKAVFSLIIAFVMMTDLILTIYIYVQT